MPALRRFLLALECSQGLGDFPFNPPSVELVARAGDTRFGVPTDAPLAKSNGSILLT